MGAAVGGASSDPDFPQGGASPFCSHHHLLVDGSHVQQGVGKVLAQAAQGLPGILRAESRFCPQSPPHTETYTLQGAGAGGCASGRGML